MGGKREQLCKGTDLQQIFDQRYAKVDSSSACKEQSFSDKEVRFIAMQIVDTLTVLSQNEIVHFDLKPANIMYDEDFGTVSDNELIFTGFV